MKGVIENYDTKSKKIKKKVSLHACDDVMRLVWYNMIWYNI